MGGRGVGCGVVGALLVLGVAACSSGGSQSSATGGMQTARVHITMSDSAGKPLTDLTETGAFDFSHHLGEFEMVLNPGTKDGSREESIVHGDVVIEQLTRDMRSSFPAAVAAGKHWVDYPGTVENNEPSGADPYTELAQLRSHRSKFVDHGMTRVDGERVRHFSTHITHTNTRATPPEVIHEAVDLYVDSQQRLIRFVVQSSTHSRTQTDYSDFGAPVHITVPPMSDVVQYSTTITPTPKLRGAWAQVASGHASGFSWKLFRAPADIDRVCWSFETTPPLSSSTSTSLPSGVVGLVGGPSNIAQMRVALGAKGPWPKHDGHDVSCTRTGIWQTDIQGIANGVAGDSGPVVAVLAPDIAKVTEQAGVGPLGTAPRAVPIDARFHGFVDAEPPPALVTSFGVGGYDLTRRDGSHASCSAQLLDSELLGSPFDPCNFPSPALPTSGLGPSVPSVPTLNP